MTRYAIDADVAIRLIRDGSDADQRHQLVGPSVLRSQALSLLFRDVRAGRLSEAEGRRSLERLAAMKIRLLGDRVSRATAWKLADRLGWDDIGPAEYLAVATLQADALVTDAEALASAAAGIVDVVGYEALARP
jgi:predicted nucleic acid-binding protein